MWSKGCKILHFALPNLPTSNRSQRYKLSCSVDCKSMRNAIEHTRKSKWNHSRSVYETHPTCALHSIFHTFIYLIWFWILSNSQSVGSLRTTQILRCTDHCLPTTSQVSCHAYSWRSQFEKGIRFSASQTRAFYF